MDNVNIYNVLEIDDIITHIFLYIPKIYHNIYKSICKILNNNIKSIKCRKCNTQRIFLPINNNNNIYCFDCLDEKNLLNNNKHYDITLEEKQVWKNIEKLNKIKYIRCKYCNVKCSTFDFCHYHIYFRCIKYKNSI